MKHQILSMFSASLIVITSGIAGQACARNALIDVDDARVGGFGGPMLRVTELGNDQAFEIGGMGGVTFTTGKHSIALGGTGVGLVNEPEIGDGNKVEMGYGGLMFGYTYNPEALVHVESHLTLGAGGLSVINSAGDTGDSGSFLFTEISSQVEVTVTEFLEFALGASYRVTTDPSVTGFDANDLSKPSVYLMFQFGSL